MIGTDHPVSDCRCNAGFTGANGGTCSQCVAGTYKDIPGVVQERDALDAIQNKSEPTLGMLATRLKRMFLFLYMRVIEAHVLCLCLLGDARDHIEAHVLSLYMLQHARASGHARTNRFTMNHGHR